jgi:hypothetical protein
MSAAEWLATIALAAVVTLAAAPYYADLSPWIGYGVFSAILVLVNMSLASRYCVPIPQMAVLMGLLQLILGAWLAWYYPMQHHSYDIGVRLPVYLEYAGPVCLALMAGFFLPLTVRVRLSPGASPPPLGRLQRARLAKVLDWLLGLGLVGKFLFPLAPGALRFFMQLIEDLAYVGAFGHLLMGMKGWRTRVAVVLVMQVYHSVYTGMFHLTILWLTYFVFLVGFRKRLGRRFMPWVLVGIVAVCVFQQVKTEYRREMRIRPRGEVLDRLMLFADLGADVLLEPGALLSPENLAYSALRLNQGWIVNRVMVWVPEREPYAEGETLYAQFVACLLPRFLNPTKFRAGGREHFERFTGHNLFLASMGLGYAGEMYANFGRDGGIAGVFVYALLLGLGFRWIYGRSLHSPLWWAWASYVAIVAVKAEDSVGFVMNWVVKASIVTAAVIWFSPEMRRVLFPSPTRPAPTPARDGAAVQAPTTA